jgi:hypothetical protein
MPWSGRSQGVEMVRHWTQVRPVACEVWDLDRFLKWTDGLILVSQRRSCKFVELGKIIEGSPCRELVAWECKPKTLDLEHVCNK